VRFKKSNSPTGCIFRQIAEGACFTDATVALARIKAWRAPGEDSLQRAIERIWGLSVSTRFDCPMGRALVRLRPVCSFRRVE